MKIKHIFIFNSTKMSDIWKYFNKAPEDKAICKTCKKEIGRKYGSTSGLWIHLQFCLDDLFKKLKEKEAGLILNEIF